MNLLGMKNKGEIQMTAKKTLIETDKYLRGEISEVKTKYNNNVITVFKEGDYDVVRVYNKQTTFSYPCGSDELYEVVKTVLIHIDNEANNGNGGNR